MGYNTDLPREEQLKIVLKNYDKKQAECSALKEKNAKLENDCSLLNKELNQTKAAYKNMLARFESQDKHGNDESAKWEAKYNSLKKKHRLKIDAYNELVKTNSKLKKCISNTFSFITNAYNNVLSVKNKLATDLDSMKYGTEDIDDTDIGVLDTLVKGPSFDGKDTSPTMPTSFAEYQQKNFIQYVRSVCKNFIITGSLRGISTEAKNFGVSALSKEQFFQYGMNTKNMTDEYFSMYINKSRNDERDR